MNTSFLRQTAEAILDQMEWKQLNRTTLVLPSHLKKFTTQYGTAVPET